MGESSARPASFAPRARSPSPTHPELARDAHHILRKSGKPDLRSGEGGECGEAQRGARAG
jgi:hypothetical protein